MSTNLVTRLVCENCGHIFEPGEIGFYSDDEEVWCDNTSFMPIKTPVIHPCMCPNCNTKFETIQTYDNAFKRIVSHSAADQAKATAKCDCTTYVTIEESRMRFEKHKDREKQPVELPIAVLVKFNSYFSYMTFINMFLGYTKSDHLSLEELRNYAVQSNGIVEYCIPGTDIPTDQSHNQAEVWKKVGLEKQCGYFNMNKKDMIDKIITNGIDLEANKVIFKPFSIKIKGD